jgi:hypothetical protein
MGSDKIPSDKTLPPRDPENTPERLPQTREEIKKEALKLRQGLDTIEKPIPWGTVVFDGFGKVEWDKATKKLTMAPKASTQKRKDPKEFQETHACLVISDEKFKQPFALNYTMKTTKQLRQNEPANNWEVGWAVFGYKDDGKFKYTMLKPEGYEMGESLLNDAQEFLDEASDKFPINKDYKVEMKVENDTVYMSVNGHKYPPYKMFDEGKKDHLTADGKIGFYTEDAEVEVKDIKMEQL